MKTKPKYIIVSEVENGYIVRTEPFGCQGYTVTTDRMHVFKTPEDFGAWAIQYLKGELDEEEPQAH
jgi:hypothetical protein